jgi:hypothetical protein
MSDAAKLDITISQGKTFAKTLRWGQPRKVYKAITGATKAAPCVLTVVGHSIPDGWLFKIASVLGMTELNSENREQNCGHYTATVVDVDSIELNDVNASGFHAYTSGGVIEYNEPVDLTGYTARMQIRASLKSEEVLLELTTENGGITIDASGNTITIYIDATSTAALTWKQGVYEVEVISTGGKVDSLAVGDVSVKQEVTR